MSIKPEDILADFERSQRYYAPIHKEMEDDFAYEAGKQWKDEDKETLRKAGVMALTINKLRPIIKLITGIERQSKSDFVAFPEGDEDGLVSDIVSALLKNVTKNSKAERKLSTQFKRGCICGMDFLEPYIDYTYDLVNGKLCIRNLPPTRCFPDPDAEEYDLSDGKFFIKFTANLTKDQLIQLFPNKKIAINKLSAGRLNIDTTDAGKKLYYTRDYPTIDKANEQQPIDRAYGYDLIDYHYKEMKSKYYVVDPTLGTVQEVDSKAKGEEYIANHQGSQCIEKDVPEIRTASLVSGEILSDEVAWTYPKWKSYPVISFFADWLTIPIDDRQLQIQGIVRNLKDLQNEYNKRRTQELRHLNSSVNSGIMYADDALSPTEEQKIKDFGSSPGVTIKYKAATTGKPERISPMPLSQGHSQLAAENAQDLKEASGVNPDLLANTQNDQSGKAILLKQKQGLVMVQEYLDNYSETKRNLGLFLLSQLGDVYTVETALKVLGTDFIKKYQEFQKPVIDPNTQQPVMGPDGKIQTEPDMQMVNQILNKVLNDSANIANYEVSIGEGPYNETVKMSNYLTLMDLVKQGFPIPPDIIVQESMLSQAQKQKIVAAIEAQQQQQMEAAKLQALTGAKPQTKGAIK